MSFELPQSILVKIPEMDSELKWKEEDIISLNSYTIWTSSNDVNHKFS